METKGNNAHSADLLISIFYTEEFKEAALVMKILSFVLIFDFFTNTYGTNYLVLKEREDIYRNVVAFSSIFGFFLSCYAVINWSYIGVAITMTSTLAVMGILSWYYAMKIKKQ